MKIWGKEMQREREREKTIGKNTVKSFLPGIYRTTTTSMTNERTNKRPTRIDNIITILLYYVVCVLCICSASCVKCEHAARNKFSVESQETYRSMWSLYNNEHERNATQFLVDQKTKTRRNIGKDTTPFGYDNNNKLCWNENKWNAKSAIFIVRTHIM